MADTGTPPVIPEEFRQYNSYVEDPLWQRKFSIIWPSVLAFFVLLAIPHLYHSIRTGRAYSTLLGISEDLTGKDYSVVQVSGSQSDIKQKRNPVGVVRTFGKLVDKAGLLFCWTLPGIGLNAGQILLMVGYAITILLCMVLEAPLMSNSNRPGFIAIAQLPIIFLFATKNSIVSLILGPGNGYEKLNFVHRWSGRAMFLGSVLHGSLWIRNNLQYDLPILGHQKETSGIAAFGLLGVIILSSLKPVRHYFYEVFYYVHMIAFIAFFVTLCYHTIYASPWIFPPLAFYGLDLFLRLFRHRIKDAVLVPVGNQMTLVHVPHSTQGWIAGQHVKLRVFFSGRVFESHPLTILSAPPDISCITSFPQGLSFGVRACGDWSNALNKYALDALSEPIAEECDANETGIATASEPLNEVPIQVMIDGPYGGCSLDLGNYENTFLIAGGSGITFTLGLLDDIVGRCVRKGRQNGERTKKIEFIWCVRSFDIATLAVQSSATDYPVQVHMTVYVTCLCDPDAVPDIPNCDFIVERPSVHSLLMDAASPEQRSSEKEEDAPFSKLHFADGGGLAVCASGPESLTREASNAVARMQLMGQAGKLGGIGLHTEVFAL
ncbi:hypothetical protein CPC08DRAFT_157968 [Agrocybe pediades]|nr:hypothetical protein CPC08DRAFT_157968 [Agrocybe pediades]